MATAPFPQALVRGAPPERGSSIGAPLSAQNAMIERPSVDQVRAQSLTSFQPSGAVVHWITFVTVLVAYLTRLSA
jgi:hypothetical protein